jgi:antirestriction protein ArdC
MSQKVIENITSKLLSAMENPTEWKKTWKNIRWHYNACSGKEYQWINSFILASTDYKSKVWMTYKQAIELWGQVRKGEKSQTIAYYSTFTTKDKDDEDKTGFVLKQYFVFNIDQVDWINMGKVKKPIEETETIQENKQIETMEKIKDNYIEMEKITIDYNSSWRCFYRPSSHYIAMVNINQFENSEAYYQTLFHELVHSTGKTLKRKQEKEEYWKGEKYAIEELVAEFGSCFALAGNIGIDIQNSSAYLAGRAKQIKEERKEKEIVWAISRAKKAVDYIFHGTVQK